MELRPYQQNALDAITAAVARGLLRLCVVMATGLGKTVLFAATIKSRPGRALVLAHRDELINQAAARIRSVMPGACVGIVKGPLKQWRADVVVASVQTLGRERTLVQMPGDFQTVVIDECHHVPAASYQRIIDRVAVADPLILGVTATPDRADGKGLDKTFEEIVFEMGIREGIAQGWLCDLEGRRVILKGADFSAVHVSKGDYRPDELAAIMQASNWHEHCTRAFLEHASDRRTVVFVPLVTQAQQLAAHMRAQGISAASLDGAMAQGERRDILARFGAGAIQVLTNCAVLTEGFDEPAISCVMMARPTKSRALYTQCVGRGLRLHPSKSDCLVLDIAGVSNRLDLVTLATLAGTGRVEDGETFTAAQERQQRETRSLIERAIERAKEQVRLEGELEARRVNLLGDAYEARKPAPGRWRNEPATPNQLAKLKQWRIRHNAATITKGEAADLMDAAIQHFKLRRAARA